MTTMPTDDLRYAIISGALSPSLHRLIRMQSDEQEAEFQLAAIAWTDRLDLLSAEADRRADVIAKTWKESPRHHADCTPRAAALRSVVHDVALGVL